MDCKVAVILPVYKNDKVPYIELSFESILNQTYKDIHLYVGIDGPVGEDLKMSLLKYAKSDNVSIQWFPENRGLAVVLNDLLNECFQNGYEYIARMDADDISEPNRIEKQMTFLQANPDIDVVGGAIEEIDENSESRGKTIVYPENPEDCFEFFLAEILMRTRQYFSARVSLIKQNVSIVLNTDKIRIQCCGLTA